MVLEDCLKKNDLVSLVKKSWGGNANVELKMEQAQAARRATWLSVLVVSAPQRNGSRTEKDDS